MLSAYLSDNPYIRRNFLVHTDRPAHDDQIRAFAAEMQLLELKVDIVTACCSEVQNVWNFTS
jgi:predicted phosphatase